MTNLSNVSPKSIAYAASIIRWHHALDKDTSQDLWEIAKFLEGHLKAKVKRGELSKLVDSFPEILQLLDSCANMLEPLEDMDYPDKDVYGSNGRKGKVGERDCDMPFWSEGGLYPRIGKEAARTLLARYTKLQNAFLNIKATQLLEKSAEDGKCDPS